MIENYQISILSSDPKVLVLILVHSAVYVFNAFIENKDYNHHTCTLHKMFHYKVAGNGLNVQLHNCSHFSGNCSATEEHYVCSRASSNNVKNSVKFSTAMCFHRVVRSHQRVRAWNCCAGTRGGIVLPARK